MENNNAYQIVFDKVIDVNASKDSWKIDVKVVLFWKQT